MEQTLHKNTTNISLIDKFPSLTLSLVALLNQQPKTWGYFQVKKTEDGLFWLCCPNLPYLRLYRNEANHIYRATVHSYITEKNPSNAGDDNRLVFTRKKQKIVYQQRQEKKQRIHEVVYKNAPIAAEMYPIGQILARLIGDRIKTDLQKTAAAFVDEVAPQVIVLAEK
ncbi:MAG: hypothetical protein D6756_09100 [Cyanobacteria bacterium J083]|nr:MAG: hypothetical protein D6756_09100 [Cyanobacteria bacterium J083]